MRKEQLTGREVDAVGFDGTLTVASVRLVGAPPNLEPGEVTATLDGSPVARGSWCECGEGIEGPATVYAEAFQVEDGEIGGRTFHGHFCGTCRHLVQVG